MSNPINIQHVTEPGGNPRLFKAGAYELLARRLGWVQPDGDGWAPVDHDVVWNTSNPLTQKIRVRGPRRQISARMARRIETMDAMEVAVLDDAGNIVKYDRRVAEAKPYDGRYRGTNFEQGAKYSGGQKAIRLAKIARDKQLGAPPPERIVRSKNDEEIAKIEARIRELMGQ